MGMQEYNKAILEDKFAINNLEAEINFSTERKLKKCVRISIGDKSAVISIDDLHAFVFAVSNIDQKADLIKTRKSFVKRLIKSHIVEAKDSIPKGGQVTIKCITDVPTLIYDEIKATFLEEQSLKNKQVDKKL